MATALEQAQKALEAGRMEEAVALAQTSARAQMTPEALHILASVALVRGLPAQAIALAGRALQLVSSHPLIDQLTARLHLVLGRGFLLEQRPDLARTAFSTAVTLFPEEAAGPAGLGEAYLALGKPRAALENFHHATRLAPRQPMLWFLCGEAARQGGRLEEAVQAFTQLVRLCPEDSGALTSLGAVLVESNAWEKALRVLEKADCLQPHQPQTLNNLALAQMRAGELLQASLLFEKALLAWHESASEQGDGLEQNVLKLNLGSVLYERGLLAEAEALFAEIEEAPAVQLPGKGERERVQARFNRAAIYLARGQWREGWQAFEARTELSETVLSETVPPQLKALPLWDGSAGPEPICLYAEQGLGDMVQFLRFLPQVTARRPVRLILLEAGLELARQVKDVVPERLLPPAGPAVARLSLLSVPHVLGLTPEPAPYLALPSSAQALDQRRLVVGVCWAGNSAYAFDRRRSVAPEVLPELLATLKSAPGLRLRCLQQNVTNPEGINSEGMEAVRLETLPDLAEAIAGCDLVISVDTLVAHLAGAMGRPLWLLNRRGGDWRWQQPDWYQDVCQFVPAQEAGPEESWRNIIAALGPALSAWQRSREPSQAQCLPKAP